MPHLEPLKKSGFYLVTFILKFTKTLVTLSFSDPVPEPKIRPRYIPSYRMQTANKELIVKIGKIATNLRATRIQCFGITQELNTELFELKTKLETEMNTIWPSNSLMTAPPIFRCSITYLSGWVSPV